MLACTRRLGRLAATRSAPCSCLWLGTHRPLQPLPACHLPGARNKGWNTHQRRHACVPLAVHQILARHRRARRVVRQAAAAAAGVTGAAEGPPCKYCGPRCVVGGLQQIERVLCCIIARKQPAGCFCLAHTGGFHPVIGPCIDDRRMHMLLSQRAAMCCSERCLPRRFARTQSLERCTQLRGLRGMGCHCAWPQAPHRRGAPWHGRAQPPRMRALQAPRGGPVAAAALRAAVAAAVAVVVAPRGAAMHAPLNCSTLHAAWLAKHRARPVLAIGGGPVAGCRLWQRGALNDGRRRRARGEGVAPAHGLRIRLVELAHHVAGPRCSRDRRRRVRRQIRVRGREDIVAHRELRVAALPPCTCARVGETSALGRRSTSASPARARRLRAQPCVSRCGRKRRDARKIAPMPARTVVMCARRGMRQGEQLRRPGGQVQCVNDGGPTVRL